MYADNTFRTEDGRVFFKIKQKTEWGGYYLFESYFEVLTEKERVKFEKDWELICEKAGRLGLTFYDSREITDAVQGRIKELMASDDAKKATAKAEETGETELVRDIHIKLFNHASGKINGLTIGISVPGKDNHERFKDEFATTRPAKGPL